ncbi:hypothetical protein MP997_22845 [Escherichia coli]|uniref:hypothetical protein n=1 Tax=Escherichia coli TaxID=562 RepID=UPI001F61831E|nr:hypothetical protein [Escherichia coli]MCA7422126.1 hypothetical protein [Escherichia coli]MCA7427179.1 hypothetical protein [Escherichia coli]MCA7452898.1 hypothetical protein [Escherichia coli]MCA7541314.1 hypothetical protein [Escherichia coli]MCA7546443.1 hypothetical protein [Escherichia coli]
MTTQITIRNKQADNLLIYIEKYKAKFEERLVAYNAVGQLEWNAGSWRFGEKGVAWLKETKDRGFKWDEVSSRIKGLSQMNISSEFQDFMRAYHMHLVCIIGGLPSGSTLDKPLQVMKRWYWEMVNKTGQTHPMYLTSDIIHAAMERHHENSDSPDNVSDYCDIAVKAIALLRQRSVSSRGSNAAGPTWVMTPAANFTRRVNASAASRLNPAPKSVRSTKSTASTVVAPGVWLAICWRPRVS